MKKEMKMSRFLAFSYGSAAYLTFLGTILYAIGFVTGLPVLKSIDFGRGLAMADSCDRQHGSDVAVRYSA